MVHHERSRRGQAGEGRVGFIITLVLFCAAVFVAMRLVPVKIDGYQFRELLREEARYASVHRNDAEIVKRIRAQAAEMNIPLKAGDLKIRRTGKEVIISASYEKPVDLKVTTYTYRFKAEQRAPTF